MILMLAPASAAFMRFGVTTSGTVYVSDKNGLIYIINNSAADQQDLAHALCKTLTPFGDWGSRGFSLLTDLYNFDLVTQLDGSLGLPQYAIATVFETGTNHGTWAKTGTGNGSGNWTQVSLLTLEDIYAVALTAITDVASETARAEAVESNLQSQIEAIEAYRHYAVGGAVDAATTTVLPANTYSNGTLGVGATLTGNVHGAFPTVDGIPAGLNQRYLIKNEASLIHNAVYKLTTLGDGGTSWVLTRSTDANTPLLLSGILVVVAGGTANSGSQWILPMNVADITIGVSDLKFIPANVSTLQIAFGSMAAFKALVAGPAYEGVTISVDSYYDDTNRGGGRFVVNAFSTSTPAGGPCATRTIAPLPANTYNNGTAGVGATITSSANGILSYTKYLRNGTAWTLGQRVLVPYEGDGLRNGIYTVTALGDVSNPWVLTRATDFDTAAEIGTAQISVTIDASSWICFQDIADITVGSTQLEFTFVDPNTGDTFGSHVKIGATGYWGTRIPDNDVNQWCFGIVADGVYDSITGWSGTDDSPGWWHFGQYLARSGEAARWSGVGDVLVGQAYGETLGNPYLSMSFVLHCPLSYIVYDGGIQVARRNSTLDNTNNTDACLWQFVTDGASTCKKIMWPGLLRGTSNAENQPVESPSTNFQHAAVYSISFTEQKGVENLYIGDYVLGTINGDGLGLGGNQSSFVSGIVGRCEATVGSKVYGTRTHFTLTASWDRFQCSGGIGDPQIENNTFLTEAGGYLAHAYVTDFGSWECLTAFDIGLKNRTAGGFFPFTAKFRGGWRDTTGLCHDPLNANNLGGFDFIGMDVVVSTIAPMRFDFAGSYAFNRLWMTAAIGWSNTATAFLTNQTIPGVYQEIVNGQFDVETGVVAPPLMVFSSTDNTGAATNILRHVKVKGAALTIGSFRTGTFVLDDVSCEYVQNTQAGIYYGVTWGGSSGVNSKVTTRNCVMTDAATYLIQQPFAAAGIEVEMSFDNPLIPFGYDMYITSYSTLMAPQGAAAHGVKVLYNRDKNVNANYTLDGRDYPTTGRVMVGQKLYYQDPATRGASFLEVTGNGNMDGTSITGGGATGATVQKVSTLNPRNQLEMIDDFIGSTIAGYWGTALGSAPPAAPTFDQTLPNGILKLITPASGTTMAVNGLTLYGSSKMVQPSKGLVSQAAQLILSATTNIVVNMGVTDAAGAAVPYISWNGSAWVADASVGDGIFLVYDSSKTSHWWLVTVKATVVQTAQDTGIVAGTSAQLLRWFVDTTGAVIVDQGTTLQAATLAAAVTVATVMREVFQVWARTATAKTLSLDYRETRSKR